MDSKTNLVLRDVLTLGRVLCPNPPRASISAIFDVPGTNYRIYIHNPKNKNDTTPKGLLHNLDIEVKKMRTKAREDISRFADFRKHHSWSLHFKTPTDIQQQDGSSVDMVKFLHVRYSKAGTPTSKSSTSYYAHVEDQNPDVWQWANYFDNFETQEQMIEDFGKAELKRAIAELCVLLFKALPEEVQYAQSKRLRRLIVREDPMLKEVAYTWRGGLMRGHDAGDTLARLVERRGGLTSSFVDVCV